MIHRLTKVLLFILTIFVLPTFILSGCSSSEEEYIFKNEPVAAYYGIINVAGCYEATNIYLSYDNITCEADIEANYQNNLIIVLSRLKSGRYDITTSDAIKHDAPEELWANVQYFGYRDYHSKSGTIEVLPFNKDDNELQIIIDIMLTQKSTQGNKDPFNYKRTVTVKYCQELDITPSLDLLNCPFK